jgi:hypothetical protein
MQGRTNNFEHPALVDLCVDFFYGSKDCLAKLFPEEFEHACPSEGIAMGATVVCHIIYIIIPE